MAVFGLYLAVSGQEPPAYTAVLTVLLIGLAIWNPVYYGRRRRRIGRLIEAFVTRAAEDQPRS